MPDRTKPRNENDKLYSTHLEVLFYAADQEDADAFTQTLTHRTFDLTEHEVYTVHAPLYATEIPDA